MLLDYESAVGARAASAADEEGSAQTTTQLGDVASTADAPADALAAYSKTRSKVGLLPVIGGVEIGGMKQPCIGQVGKDALATLKDRSRRCTSRQLEGDERIPANLDVLMCDACGGGHRVRLHYISYFYLM